MNDFAELEKIMDDSTTYVTVQDPIKKGTYAALTPKFQYFRENVFHGRNEPLLRLSEKDVRIYLATSCRNVERAMASLHRGKTVRTRYGTYTATQV